MADIWAHIVADFANIGSPSAMAAFVQVLMIDIMLAGDNAIVVGALAAGLPTKQRKQVILIGIVAALVLRIVFAISVSALMSIVGLVLAGGLLLLWVAWKMFRELRSSTNHDGNPSDHDAIPEPKSFMGAAWAVALADVSMSLDNVLAVAGAAREHPGILVIGLLLSVALMGLAANIIAKYIERFRWIAYVGLLVILYVAIKMIYEGSHQIIPLML
ncbi:integral membrane protein, YjbE family [Sphingomonas sp. YR710]|nr:integral membrane protein, YjbE family [Sphingomonas sp. YR710]